MRFATLMIMLAAPLALAACDNGNDSAETADMPMADEKMAMGGEDMPMMQSGESAEIGRGEGTVTAVDAEKITIDHGPIPEVNWPAMTMAFEADETAREAVAVGDAVTFAFRKTDSGGEITSITKR
ncbi:copper-binding protein [uncultured Croceicoccus sp.]|uniref:copper-binding protein n=1 Tax=uncultured Croceicoccus sp. TaxID=1295329 RepID=UPI0026281D41|nr:copper-binding protein [uncultured Croceicoccus sp.]